MRSPRRIVTAVITTSALREASAGLLPSRPKAILRSSTHVYHVYRLTISSLFQDYVFVDPIDGDVLVQCKYFDDESAARLWVATDIALRTARTDRIQ